MKTFRLKKANMIKFKGQWYMIHRNLLPHYFEFFRDAEEAFDVPTYRGVTGKDNIQYVDTLRDLYKVVQRHDLLDHFEEIYGKKRMKNLQKRFIMREIKGK